MKKLFFIVSCLLLLAVQAKAVSIVTYGAKTQADLTVLSAISSTFTYQLCVTTQPANCTGSNITWSPVTDSNTDGNVDNPNNGTMNAQGWWIANRFIKVSSVKENRAGWVLQIYTDNIANGYTGPLKDVAPIAGMVSSDHQFLIPMTWKVSSSTITYSVGITTNVPQEITASTGGVCQNGGVRTNPGFCDFSTHYLCDVGDRDTTAQHNTTWWQNMSAGPAKDDAKAYQSLLSSDGAATHEGFRQSYTTLPPGIGTYFVYLGAKFSPGTIARDIHNAGMTYNTTLLLDLVTQ